MKSTIKKKSLMRILVTNANKPPSPFLSPVILAPKVTKAFDRFRSDPVEPIFRKKFAITNNAYSSIGNNLSKISAVHKLTT